MSSVVVTQIDPSWIVDLTQAGDRALTGGKAVNLARLLAAGFAVPGGFVLTTAAFRAVRHDPTQREALWEAVSEHYRRLGSPPVAVRSSATAEDLAAASMAGQYETILDVRDEDTLYAAIIRCWESLDQARVHAYLGEHGIAHADVAMAVVVQRLVPATVAGVLFTANPQRGRRDEMLLEAHPGLGEAVVSGAVQPDTVVIDHATGAVRSAVHAAATGCLDSHDVHALWTLGRRIEQAFGAPQDIEWALQDGTLSVLQARAITTLAVSERIEQARDQAQEFLRAARSAGRGPWVAHNLGETLPHATPFTWSLIQPFMSGAGGFGDLYRLIGFAPDAVACSEGVLDRIAGRIYMDCARGPGLFAEQFPYAYDIEQLRTAPDAGQAAPSRAVGGLAARVRAARMLGAVGRRLDALAAQAAHDFRMVTVPAWRTWLAEESNVDLTTIPTADLIGHLHRRAERVLRNFAPQSLLPGFVSAHLVRQLEAQIAEAVWDADAATVVRGLLVADAADATVRSDQHLHEVGSGERTLADWLAEHGHRAPGEFELAEPRWRERPDDLLPLARSLAGGPQPLGQHRHQAEQAGRQAEALAARLEGREAATFRQRLAQLRALLPLREDAKDELMRGYALLRAVACEAGRRLAIGDDVFQLTRDETAAALAVGYAPLAVIAERTAERAAERRLTLPTVIADAEIADLGRLAVPAHQPSHAAFAISAGIGTGPARIVRDPVHAGDLGRGYVLVCRSTDPAWTPLFSNAAGLVLECGGSLSHGAVVARELGIPAVVLPSACDLIAEGEVVTVDGTDARVVRGAPTSTTAAPAAPLPPPPVGAGERRLATWRSAAVVVWAVYLTAAFALPPAWLYDPTFALMDTLLWPLVTTVGKVGAVAVIAAVLALSTMLMQRLLSDHRRLVTAKERARAAQQAANALPADDPRRPRWLALAQGVQGRLAAAAFAPVALLLGPLILIFLWIPVRLDPAAWSKPPGALVRVTVTIDGEVTEPITLLPSADGLLLPAHDSAVQTPVPTRAALTALRMELAAASEGDLPWVLRATARERRQELVSSLDAILAGPMPDQEFVWELRSPTDRSGTFPVQVQAGSQPALHGQVALGDRDPPTLAEQPGAGGIRTMRIATRGRTLADDLPGTFWAPVGGFDWGWLGVYLLAYLPVMFLTKHLLRVP